MDSFSAQSAQLQALHQALLEKKLDFQATFPELVREYQDHIVQIEHNTQVTVKQDDLTRDSVLLDTLQEAQERFGEKKAERLKAVTREEIDFVFTKLEQMIASGIHVLPGDEQLYLEQQISDIIGCSVTTELDGRTLPYTWGVAASLPHMKRHPTDSLDAHDAVLEAGLFAKRGAVGWLSPLPALTEEVVLQEAYSLSVPVLLQDANQESADTLITWYKNKKVLVINPTAKKIAAAKLVPFSHQQLEKYSVGLSPELSRAIEAWRPPSHGTISFLLIDDPDESVPLGTIHYDIQL